jgi:hypothetical protein
MHEMLDAFDRLTYAPGRKHLKGAPIAVGAWTGRSALSWVTTTARPAIATAGGGKTRVSEMRG